MNKKINPGIDGLKLHIKKLNYKLKTMQKDLDTVRKEVCEWDACNAQEYGEELTEKDVAKQRGWSYLYDKEG